MDLSLLKSQMQLGDLEKFYIFTGPEVKIMDIYIGIIAKVTNSSVKRLSSSSELAQKAYNKDVLRKRSVYVLRDSKEFISDEAFQTFVTQRNTFTDCIILFLYSSIDKRSRLYKNYQDRIVEFEHLSDNILTKYIHKEIDPSRFDDKACKNLIDVCESDYGRILLEIDKIKNLTESSIQSNNPSIHNESQAFYSMLKDGTIYQPPYDAVFDFVDAVLRRKPALAFNLLEQSYASGEATMVLLSNLYNSAKQLLQVQAYDYSGSGKITEATGLTPFQVKLASGRKHIYTNGELLHLMWLTREAEKGIKTGAIEDMMAVPYILVNLW